MSSSADESAFSRARRAALGARENLFFWLAEALVPTVGGALLASQAKSALLGVLGLIAFALALPIGVLTACLILAPYWQRNEARIALVVERRGVALGKDLAEILRTRQLQINDENLTFAYLLEVSWKSLMGGATLDELRSEISRLFPRDDHYYPIIVPDIDEIVAELQLMEIIRMETHERADFRLSGMISEIGVGHEYRWTENVYYLTPTGVSVVRATATGIRRAKEVQEPSLGRVEIH